MKNFHIPSLALAVFITATHAQGGPPRWMTEGPTLDTTVDASPAAFEVPLETLGRKLYVTVELGGKPRRFVLDTGSPSMIDETLAEELGLEPVGTNRGRDAHGAVIETRIVQTDLEIGGVSFRKVPLFSAPFSRSVATRVFIGDGVLGSELLPLGAWQIDLKDSVLRFHTDATRLPHVKESRRAKLHDFGYPHAPILDVAFSTKARSKAMLDTGSPACFAISPDDSDGAAKADAIGHTVRGYGSPGASLGGQAPAAEQWLVELKDLSLGPVALGRVEAVKRTLSPSLVGAGILERFIVTLDARSGAAYFLEYDEYDEYDKSAGAATSFGFTLAFDGAISVALVWDGSKAEAAGLRPGLRLTSINGLPAELSPEGIRQVARAMEGPEIQLEWDGGAATLARDFSVFGQ